MKAIDKKELRKEVKQYINHADDRMLKAIHAMLEADQEKEMKTDDDWVSDMSSDEKADIKKAIKQLDNGEVIPHEEAIKRLKWVPK